MKDIRDEPFVTRKGLTLKELKELISMLPDQDKDGISFEVWVTTAPNLSNVVKQVWSLNKREDGCDIILEV